MNAPIENLRMCSTCGLVQSVPDMPARTRACCHRCGVTVARNARRAASNRGAAALALSALIFYPLAMTLPMVRIERMGYSQETSVLTGIGTLFGRNQWFIGIIILFCSVVFPLIKLCGLLALSTERIALTHHYRAWLHRVIDWTGRWGMLDVLLVAILVAAIKLGDVVSVTAGPAVFAFACTVLLSLAAGAVFDPQALWKRCEIERIAGSTRANTRATSPPKK